jgi:hypothetical protein
MYFGFLSQKSNIRSFFCLKIQNHRKRSQKHRLNLQKSQKLHPKNHPNSNLFALLLSLSLSSFSHYSPAIQQKNSKTNSFPFLLKNANPLFSTKNSPLSKLLENYACRKLTVNFCFVFRLLTLATQSSAERMTLPQAGFWNSLEFEERKQKE